MRIFAVAWLLPCLACAANLIDASAHWQNWSPRPALQPVFEADGGKLAIRARKFADYGKWVSPPLAVQGGGFYRFQVQYRASGVKDENVSVAAMLSWFGAASAAPAVQRDYVDKPGVAGEWKTLSRTLQAPAASTSVTAELVLRWTEGGSVEWRSPQLERMDAPARRVARIATTHIRPPSPRTIEGNLALMTSMIDAAGREKADLICLSENLAERADNLTLEQKAHPIPGPITDKLGAAAKRNNVWVVTALVEREGDMIFNTAVLIDRSGRVVSKYRKVHLPLAEAEDGMTPGNDYQVFDTDFGRVGLIVCWDNWFPETARILRSKGAEIFLFPLAGDTDEHWELMSRARAVDNGVYIVSSNTTGGASRIVNPAGEVLAQTSGDLGLAITNIDLNQEWRTKWLSIGPGLGEGRSLYWKERRPDTYR